MQSPSLQTKLAILHLKREQRSHALSVMIDMKGYAPIISRAIFNSSDFVSDLWSVFHLYGGFWGPESAAFHAGKSAASKFAIKHLKARASNLIGTYRKTPKWL